MQSEKYILKYESWHMNSQKTSNSSILFLQHSLFRQQCRVKVRPSLGNAASLIQKEKLGLLKSVYNSTICSAMLSFSCSDSFLFTLQYSFYFPLLQSDLLQIWTFLPHDFLLEHIRLLEGLSYICIKTVTNKEYGIH